MKRRPNPMATRMHSQGKTDLIKAGIHRLRDAWQLLEAGRLRGAMYLAGYAVECKLKARLLDQHKVATLAELERVLQRKIKRRIGLYVHHLNALGSLLVGWNRLSGFPAFQRCWSVALSWSVGWRYAREHVLAPEARAFLSSIEECLRWIDRSV